MLSNRLLKIFFTILFYSSLLDAASILSSGDGKPITLYTTGGCGMPANFINSNSINFNNIALQKGFNNLQESDFGIKGSFEKDFGGFKCKALLEIPDATIPKNEPYTTSIQNINFHTGQYTCVYNFLNTKSFYQINHVNESCKHDDKAIEEAMKNINNISNLNFGGGYGIKGFGTNTSTDPYLTESNERMNIGADFKSAYEDLVLGLEQLDETYNRIGEKTTVNIGSSLDSHTNHPSTLASIILGVLTFDTEFLESPAIKEDGTLNIKAFAVSYGKGDDEQIGDLLSTLDKSFWGFYYYMINNVNRAFSNIVNMIFGLGTIGVFGFAYAKRLSDDDKQASSTQFDFKNKFIGVFTAFSFFSAPIIPVTQGIPAQYVYMPSSNIDNQRNGDIAQNTTAIQVTLRYMFQLGTYWANQVNDYAFFSYLKYIGSSSGQYKPTAMLDSATNDMSDFLQRAVALKKEILFFENTCGSNYYNELAKKKTLPNYPDGLNQGIKELQENTLGYTKADYNYCSQLLSTIQEKSDKEQLMYRNVIANTKNAAKTLENITKSEIEQTDEFMRYVINLNNKFGWISIAIIPSLQQVLEAKKISSAINIASENAKSTVNNIGQMQTRQEDRLKDPNTEIISGLSEKAQDATWYKRWWSNIAGTVERNSEPIFSTIGSGFDLLGNGSAMLIGKIGEWTMFMAFPGFGDILSQVHKSGVPAYIIEQGSLLIDKITNFIPFGSQLQWVSKANKFLSKIGVEKASALEALMIFIISYLIAVFLYTTLLATMMMILTSALIIIKIVYFYIEIIIAVFISLAVMLWSLSFDGQRTSSTVAEFFYKTSILALSPISIVLSVYVFIFAKSTMFWIYRLVSTAIFQASMQAQNKLNAQELFAGALSSLHIYTTYNIGEMILMFLSIFIAYNIIFNFPEWVLNYFGHKGDKGISGSIESVFQEIKSRTMSRT